VEELGLVSDLGIHILTGEMLLAMLHRVEDGEGAEDVYMETYANAHHIDNEEGDDGEVRL
jgi:hypothetical protein